ncbi:hypothetical protein [Arcticibacter eurypsychrophilus]|uniref:hypothetical protein n=1 Tax=Arcticibacter eurypsychrophilus TaxID=1434752 RepID=UPI00084DAC7E|nr:hypothetical protein [Arcticibacter eurypsychrophilus]
MKKFIIVLAILVTVISVGTTNAQVRVNVNIGTPAYYYMPDQNAYYNVSERSYYYEDGGRWIHRSYLPGRYRNYTVYNVRHIEVNEHRPYLRHNYYREKYSRSKNYRGESRRHGRYDYDRDRNDDRGHNDNRGGGHDKGGDRGHGHGKHK